MNMLAQIIANTPKWVFVLFFVLLAFGIIQMRTQVKSVKRVLILPIVLLILSLAGVISAFGVSTMPITAWAAGYVALAVLIGKGLAETGSSFDTHTKKLTVAGSAIPLILMMSIFFLKYFVGASTALKASFTLDIAFPVVVSLLYGIFSGVFAGRALRLLKLVKPS